MLQRGFAVVRGPEGVITQSKDVTAGLALDIEFADGKAAAVGAGGKAKPAKRAGKAKSKTKSDDPQGSLL